MAGTTDDPYEEYRWLRDEQPLYYSEEYGFYAVSRYDDVRTVSRDWETYTSAQGVDVDNTALLGGPNVLESDPPIRPGGAGSSSAGSPPRRSAKNSLR